MTNPREQATDLEKREAEFLKNPESQKAYSAFYDALIHILQDHHSRDVAKFLKQDGNKDFVLDENNDYSSDALLTVKPLSKLVIYQNTAEIENNATTFLDKKDGAALYELHYEMTRHLNADLLKAVAVKVQKDFGNNAEIKKDAQGNVTAITFYSSVLADKPSEHIDKTPQDPNKHIGVDELKKLIATTEVDYESGAEITKDKKGRVISTTMYPILVEDQAITAKQIENDAKAAEHGDKDALTKLRDEIQHIGISNLHGLAKILVKDLGKSKDREQSGVKFTSDMGDENDGEITSMTFRPAPGGGDVISIFTNPTLAVDIDKTAKQVEDDAMAAEHGDKGALARLHNEIKSMDHTELDFLAEKIELDMGKSQDWQHSGVEIRRDHGGKEYGDVTAITFRPSEEDRWNNLNPFSSKEAHSVKVTVTPVGNYNAESKSVERIKQAYEKLPPKVRELLVMSDYKITIVYKFSDLYPEAKFEHPRDPDASKNASLDTDALGYCNWEDKEILIQDKMDGADKEFENTLRHEVGHAIDDLIGDFSHSLEFTAAYMNDTKNIPEAARENIKYYLQDDVIAAREETFAELFAKIQGGSESRNMAQYFPHCEKVMRDFLAKHDMLPK